MNAAYQRANLLSRQRRYTDAERELGQALAGVEAKLRDAMKTGKLEPLGTKDLTRAASGVRPSTKEWFATAKNYALYANQGGAYDDVMST